MKAKGITAILNVSDIAFRPQDANHTFRPRTI